MTLYDWFKPQIDAVRASNPSGGDFRLYYFDYVGKRLEVMATTFMELAESKLRFRKMEGNLPRTR